MASASNYLSPEEGETTVDAAIGYPKAYAKCCRDGGLVGIYLQGPPFTFTPYYPVQHHEIERARDLDQLFPVLDPKAKPTAKLKIFVSLLWKQLNHLGNAGFDPEVIRVDPYGNVVYFHADKASPLYWDIDHWFPCSRGGLTVPSNLRILQWQVCKRKHNKLEFQVPWWDLQLGISVNQFLSIFASSNSDFRRRGFSFLFLEGENEEVNESQTVESHSFPHHFSESKKELGLAPASIVVSRRRGEPHDASSTTTPLKSLDYNKQMIRPYSPIVAANKAGLKENEDPEFALNPYQAIVKARDSLKQRREEEAHKLVAEIQNLDGEVDELMRSSNKEKLVIQDLELELTKRRRRAEKCRRLAEAQSSYRTMLEKMIRDAMHQSVVYKEQVRLNQAATTALMARLEAQKSICDASEKELHKKFRERDALEKEIRPEWEEQARKRSRMDHHVESTDNFDDEEQEIIDPHNKALLYLEEDDQLKASEADDGIIYQNEYDRYEGTEDERKKKEADEHDQLVAALEDQVFIEEKLQALEIDDEEKKHPAQLLVTREQATEDGEDDEEESRNVRGKGNVDKWLKMLLENSQDQIDPEDIPPPPPTVLKTSSSKTTDDNIINRLNDKFPLKEQQNIQPNANNINCDKPAADGEKLRRIARNKSFDQGEQSKKALPRSESARTLRRIPSSPSLLISGVRKGVESMFKMKNKKKLIVQ
ncbi:hypothetical protein LINGRAHAP2_LOCUS7283 [Linum grandiflorum]